MKTNILAWSIPVVLLAAGFASAYHIPDQSSGHVARTWTAGAPGLAVCETIGPNDPINPQPLSRGGVNGLCYPASQDFWDEALVEWDEDAKKDKKISIAESQTENPDTTWSFFEPKCKKAPQAGGTPCDIGADKWLTPDWFARVGTNAHSCNGVWEQEFRYKEMLAYYHGSQPNEHGVSGHIAFFVEITALVNGAFEGTYNNGKGADAPGTKGSDFRPDDPDGLIFGTLCTSNFVGLSDDSTKKDP